MKNKFFAVLILGILVFSGCTKLPQTELNAANAAIEQAKASGADIYLPDDFIALKDSMNAITVNIESTKSKVFKNFADEKEQLEGITELALQLNEHTLAIIEELKVEIQKTIEEVGQLIEANRQLILEAPRGKEGTSALLAIKAELNTIESSINEAAFMLENQEYLATLDKAKAAKEKATAIKEELTSVITKYKANVKGR